MVRRHDDETVGFRRVVTLIGAPLSNVGIEPVVVCALTDLPLVLDGPVEFSADDTCARCRVCTNECPPQSIML